MKAKSAIIVSPKVNDYFAAVVAVWTSINDAKAFSAAVRLRDKLFSELPDQQKVWVGVMASGLKRVCEPANMRENDRLTRAARSRAKARKPVKAKPASRACRSAPASLSVVA